MLRPLEKNEINRFFYLKVFLLLVLIGASVYGNYYFYNRKKESSEVLSMDKENKKVNFSVDEVLSRGRKTVDDLKQKGEEMVGEVLGLVEDKATQLATQSAKTVSDVVFDSTLGNFLKQIEKLPKEQREKIKEEICKP